MGRSCGSSLEASLAKYNRYKDRRLRDGKVCVTESRTGEKSAWQSTGSAWRLTNTWLRLLERIPYLAPASTYRNKLCSGAVMPCCMTDQCNNSCYQVYCTFTYICIYTCAFVTPYWTTWVPALCGTVQVCTALHLTALSSSACSPLLHNPSRWPSLGSMISRAVWLPLQHCCPKSGFTSGQSFASIPRLSTSAPGICEIDTIFQISLLIPRCRCAV